MQGTRLLGDGYEPQVWLEGERLTYSLPVDSGFVSFNFTFDIRQRDLDVLRTDNYRLAVLEIVAHTVLQHSTLKGNPRLTQSDFDNLVADVLHSTSDALQAFITRIGQQHNIAIEHYVKEILKRLAMN